MKKCSFCGLENPDDAVKCQQCQQSLVAPPAAASGPRPPLAGRILPAFLSYFLVASGLFLYDYIRGRQTTIAFPPHFMVLDTTLTPDQLVARLVKAGVPKESILGALAPPPAVMPALEHHFILLAIALLAFCALTRLFKRFFSK